MLSSIQQGIQGLHATVELFVKYPSIPASFDHVPFGGNSLATHLLWEWAVNYKTAICLNGGNAADIRAIMRLLNDPGNPYPWALFRESDEALDRNITCVAIVLPMKFFRPDWDAIAASVVEPAIVASPFEPTYTAWELEFGQVKSRCPLAR